MLDPAQLELELSEEIIVERLDTRLSILRELVDLGVKLAIDDDGRPVLRGRAAVLLLWAARAALLRSLPQSSTGR